MMEERRTRLVEAKRARASTGSSQADVPAEPDTSNVASTSGSSSVPDTLNVTSTLGSSSVQQLHDEQSRSPSLLPLPPESEFVVEETDMSSDEHESEDNNFDDEHVQEVFKELILCLPLNHRHMLGVLADSFRKRQGLMP